MNISELFAGSKHIVLAEQIFPAKFQRIEPETLSDHVHLALVSPHRLGHAEAAQRPSRYDVGPNRAGIDTHVRNSVGTGHGGAAVARHHRADIAVGAGVEICAHLTRHQSAVFHYSGFDPNGRRVLADGDKFLLAAENDFYRLP